MIYYILKISVVWLKVSLIGILQIGSYIFFNFITLLVPVLLIVAYLTLS